MPHKCLSHEPHSLRQRRYDMVAPNKCPRRAQSTGCCFQRYFCFAHLSQEGGQSLKIVTGSNATPRRGQSVSQADDVALHATSRTQHRNSHSLAPPSHRRDSGDCPYFRISRKKSIASTLSLTSYFNVVFGNLNNPAELWCPHNHVGQPRYSYVQRRLLRPTSSLKSHVLSYV